VARAAGAVALGVVVVAAAVWSWPPAGGAHRAGIGPGAIVTYHYGRVGIASPGHDGWTLTIDHRYAAFQAFDGTRVVATRNVPVPPAVWRRLATGARDVASLQPSGSDGCPRPRSRVIRVFDDGHALIDRQFDVCGGNTVAVAHRIDTYVAPAVALVPDFTELTHR
jgi:hypothetical protein